MPPIRLLPLIKLRKKRSLPVRILTSPKTTLGLTAVLGGLLFPAIGVPVARTVGRLLVPKTFGAAAKTAFAAGVLSVAPSLARTFNPFKAGQRAAPFIADPSKLLPKPGQPLKEKVVEAAKVGGLGVAAAAALLGSATLLSKAIKRFKPGAAGLPGLPGLPGVPGVSLPGAMAPVISQPFGPAVKPAPEKPVATLPSMSNKIIFKPEISIRFSKSRKFINQQLIIK